jgi:hypothetical protein
MQTDHTMQLQTEQGVSALVRCLPVGCAARVREGQRHRAAGFLGNLVNLVSLESLVG